MSRKGPKFYSVTFKVLDEAKFQELAAKFSGEMHDGTNALVSLKGVSKAELRGYEVTACGWGDFASQADYYQSELEDQGIDPSEVIGQAVDRDYPEHTEEEREALITGILG